MILWRDRLFSFTIVTTYRVRKEIAMNRAAVSVFAWGIYLVGSGLGFFLTPNLVLPIFRFSPATEGWIRVAGLLVTIVGIYYIYCARNNDITFIRITAYGRVVFALGSLILVLFKLIEPPLLLIGAVDVCGAIWTWLSLRSMSETKGAVARA
jgi:hypothetical protein